MPADMCGVSGCVTGMGWITVLAIGLGAVGIVLIMGYILWSRRG
jgi:hypothetical protein